MPGVILVNGENQDDRNHVNSNGDEFHLAENLMVQYHGQKADPVHDRIFGVFIDGNFSASAR